MRLELKRARILTLGEALTAAAREALPDAQLEACDGPKGLAEGAASFDLAMIDADAIDPALLSQALTRLAQAKPQPAVLLTGSHLPTGLVRALFQLARSDVLERPFAVPALADAVDTLLRYAPAQASGAPSTPASHCWVVTGAVGGAGATTLAVETAAILAKAGRGRVALVDLNLADGAAAAYLGARPNLALAEASAAPDRIDTAVLGAFAVEAAPNLDLFAAPRDPDGFAKVSAEAVCRLLDAACQAYPWVVVDAPRIRQPWTVNVLTGADEILIVSELTVPALLAARALALEIDAETPAGGGARVILNRVAGRMFGPAPSLGEAERALGRKADGGITSDWEAAACSVNLGGPISHHRPKSRIVKDVSALVERLSAHAVRAKAA